MTMRPIDFAAVKKLIDLDALLRLMGVTPTAKYKGTYRSQCPFKQHSDARSFAVSPDGFTCHSCRRKGDLLRLWSEWCNEPILSATYALCERLGIDPPILQSQERGRGTVSNGER